MTTENVLLLIDESVLMLLSLAGQLTTCKEHVQAASVELSKATRIELPIALQEHDPDPTGRHKMSDQRRLDTAFEEYRKRLDVKLREVFKGLA